MSRDPWAGRIRMLVALALITMAFVIASSVATLVHAGIVGAFIDAAGSIPLKIWLALAGLAVMVAVLIWAMTAPVITPEQREEIARCHREWTGDRGMPSTRSTAPPRGGTSPRHPTTRGQAATAQERGRPRRAR